MMAFAQGQGIVDPPTGNGDLSMLAVIAAVLFVLWGMSKLAEWAGDLEPQEEEL